MIPILMYHQVAEIPRDLDPLGLAIPPEQFERQMSYLARKGYHCLTLSEAVRYFQESQRAPEKSFVLTFDDGYQDVYTQAYPILDRYGFTATVFLVAGRIGSRSNWWGQEGEYSNLLLTWSEVQDLAQRGFIFGSHTFSHPRLSTLDDSSAYEEIQASKAFIQDRMGMQIDFFSYPYSNTDARIEQLVASAGYQAACAGDSGPLSLFHLWRVPCFRDETQLSFAIKVNGLYCRRSALCASAPWQLLRRYVRKVRRKFMPNYSHQPYALKSSTGEKSEREF